MRLSVEDLDFSYGNSKVLDGISFDLEGQGLTCIIGPNGVGKSTLVKCLDGINKPTGGRISIDGRDIASIPPRELAKLMAFVPVVSGDMFSMTVFDTVMMGRRPHQRLGNISSLDKEIVRRTLNMMGIRDLSMRGSNELSAGQHQRMVIARGLAQTPRFLLLDEPTANLDARHQIQVTMTLRDLASRGGMSVVMISHDLNIASRFADRIVMMAPPGVVRAIGRPEEVITENSIRDVYGVDCSIVDVRGRPHVILLDPIRCSGKSCFRLGGPVLGRPVFSSCAGRSDRSTRHRSVRLRIAASCQ
ncbi:MAG: ABC transporter ATP-binding protein [Candidatus Methanomethylophilaceae archaeon]|nr:ABC transporter ATP-binding protein [Candidatus Methanomethylophilaceae archaeon]